jgi:hypothetical protein
VFPPGPRKGVLKSKGQGGQDGRQGPIQALYAYVGCPGLQTRGQR